jgi:leucyl/phenylalanyl-tRNA--protein transferase
MSPQTPRTGFPDRPRFPPVEQAQPDGLLLVGGQLTPEWLLAAYSQGIFPWPSVGAGWEVLAWYSPDPRAVLELDAMHVPRRLQRRIRRGEFTVTWDRDFAAVVAQCAAPREAAGGTWITAEMAAAYGRLHALGHAHSVEVWQAERLVGGLYGVALGGFFAGESMFHRVRDAANVALVCLVERLRQRGFVLFDVQQASPHLQRLGAVCVPRALFLQRLQQAIALPVSFVEAAGCRGN